MSLHFVPLGVGDAFTADYYSTCLAVESEGRWLLIDCPHPIRKMMKEAGTNARVALDVDRIDGVVLTHLHADHASGLEGFGFFSVFALQRNARLFAHPDVLAGLWDQSLRGSMGQLMGPNGDKEPTGLHHFFDVAALSEVRPIPFGPFEIECRITKHHIPTTALRIKAGKRTLSYSSDTAFDPELIEWLGKGDVIIHETNYGPAHTAYNDLLTLDARTRAKMRLVHYPDTFDTKSSQIECLEQGKWYRV